MNSLHISVFCQAMMTKITTYFADLVRAAFLPESLEKKNEKDRAKLGEWGDNKNEVGAGAWLPQCVRSIRCVFVFTHLEIQKSFFFFFKAYFLFLYT